MERHRNTTRGGAPVALILAANLLFTPVAARAFKGFCSQPSSNGPELNASDCLYVLKVAVGLLTCSPACSCAPKGTLPTKATDALLCLRKSVGQPVSLLCPCPVPDRDDFDDNSVDPDKWFGSDEVDGNGVLTETGHALQYTCDSGTTYDQSVRVWFGSVVPYATDWEVQVDVANSTVGTSDDHVNSFGISIIDMGNPDSELYGELYVSRAGGPPSRSGFYGELYDDNNFIESVDTGGLGVTAGAVRIAFDAGNKVVTLSYDTDSSNGYTWVPYGSFGLDGTGGDDANSDWDLDDGDRFGISLYGYSSNMVVTPGQMRADDFHVTGGVMP